MITNPATACPEGRRFATACLWICALLALLPACHQEPVTDPDAYVLAVPPGFPYPSIPDDNALTRTRVQLGKLLFYDPILSRDSTRSCGSCHLPAHAFSDTTAVSLGIEQRPGTRNTPTLANVAYHPYLLREGGVPTLEMQVLVPIQEHNEFDFRLLDIAELIRNKRPDYVAMTKKAYGREPDPYTVTRAIAAFERTLLGGNAPYDQYTYQGNAGAMTASALRGKALFDSDSLACSKCHSGFLFTSFAFENNGLYEVYADPGRKRLTSLDSDLARFKVPTLRNVALTAPYMHDGSLPTLRAVVEHYATGGKNHPSKSPLLRPFVLSAEQKQDLIAFLESLTDRTFAENKAFRPE